MFCTLAGSLVVSAYSIVNILSFTLNVDYDLRIQYAGYSPAIPRNLLSRLHLLIVGSLTVAFLSSLTLTVRKSE